MTDDPALRQALAYARLPARDGDTRPQAVPLHLGHELGGVGRQPGRRGGQHGRDQARTAPGRLPRHRVPPRVQAEGMPGVTPRRYGGPDLAISTLTRTGSHRQGRAAAAPSPRNCELRAKREPITDA
jgi:hypothetical protein